MKKYLHASLIALLAILVIAFVGTISVGNGESEVDIKNVQLENNRIVGEVNANLEQAAIITDMLASEAEIRFRQAGDVTDPQTQQAILEEIYEQSLANYPDLKYVSNAFFHLSVDITGNGTTGFYYTMEDDEIAPFDVTDITAYPKDDLPHVGWYFVPLNYGYGVWLEPYENRNNDIYMFSYGVPVFVDDTEIGVLGIELDIANFEDQLRDLMPYSNCSISVMDKSGAAAVKVGAVSDYVDNMSVEGKLINEMSLRLTVPQSEVHSVKGTFLYKFLLIFYIIAFVVVGSILIWNLINQPKSKIEKQAVAKEKDTAPVKVGKAKIAIAIIMGILFVSQIGSTFIMMQMKRSQTVEDVVANNYYSETIVVAADEAFEPYSSYDEEGNMVGHDIDLISALANRVGVNVDIRLATWDECQRMVRDGEADVLLSAEIMDAIDSDEFIYSERIVDDEFVFYGKTPISSILDLRGASIAYVSDAQILEIYGLDQRAINFVDYIDVMEALEKGQVDYVLIRKSIAEWICSTYDYKDLLQVYEVKESYLGLGFSRDNLSLAERMNAEIVKFREDGTLSGLYKKWFLQGKDQNSFVDYLIMNQPFLIVTGFLMAVCIIILLVMYMKSRQDKEQEIKHKSEMDGLTDILNRATGEGKIRTLIGENVPGMFILFDVDKFKAVNDTYGHIVGDEVLIAVANAMKIVFRERDIILRLGGDEFAAYAPRVVDEEIGIKIMNRLFYQMEQIEIPAMKDHKPTISVGNAFFLAEGESFEDIYREADQKLYISKTKPGNQYTF